MAGLRHGTAYHYDLGCRCNECGDAKRAKRRAARDKARAENRPSYQRELAASRALKENYRGTCENCGAATTGCNGPNSAPTLCLRCSAVEVGLRKRGSGPTQQALLKFLRRERRFMEIVRELGIPREQMGMLLGRLMDYGLIERTRRGHYRRLA